MTTPPSRPTFHVHRGRKMPWLLWLHASLAYTLAFLLVPPRELLTRWRSTGAYLTIYALAVIGLWQGLGTPLTVAATVGLLWLLVGMFAASLIVSRYRCADAWAVRRGPDAAVILLEHRRGRRRWVLFGPRGEGEKWVLHSWSAWRQHRGLGTAVAVAAFAQAPRPLWLQAATPDLAQVYTRHGAHHAGDGRWMVLPAIQPREGQ